MAKKINNSKTDPTAYQQGYDDSVTGKPMDEYFKQFDGYVQGYNTGIEGMGAPPRDEALIQELKDCGVDDYEIEGFLQGVEDAKVGRKRKRNYKTILGYADGYKAAQDAIRKDKDAINEMCKHIRRMTMSQENIEELNQEYDSFLAQAKQEELIEKMKKRKQMISKLAFFFAVNSAITAVLLFLLSEKKEDPWAKYRDGVPPPPSEGATRRNISFIKASLGANNKWGLFDENGKEILPPIYDSIRVLNSSNETLTVNGAITLLDGKEGFIDGTGKEIVPAKYEAITIPNDEIMNFKEKGMWGVMNKSGKILLPAVYNSISDYYNGFAQVQENKLLGFINKAGIEAIPPRFAELGYFNSYGVTWYVNGSKVGLVDSKGVELDVPEFNYVIQTDNGFKIQNGDLWGYLDPNGKSSLSVSYSSITEESGMLKLKKYSRYGLADLQGNIILPCEYNEIKTLGDKFLVKQGDRNGVYDQQGKEILSCDYDLITQTDDGQYYFVFKDGRSGYFDLQGNELVPCEYQAAYMEGAGYAKIEHFGLIGWYDVNAHAMAIPLQYDFVWGKFESKNDVVKVRKPTGEVIRIDYYGREVSGKSLKGLWDQITKD